MAENLIILFHKRKVYMMLNEIGEKFACGKSKFIAVMELKLNVNAD